MTKKGLWYPIQTLPQKKEQPKVKNDNAGKWYPIQTLVKK
jgi:uncharacterized protein YbaR (Trm112 family)